MCGLRFSLVSLALVTAFSASAQTVPSPKTYFGHDVCEDYWLANYKQLVDYWNALSRSSPRLKVVPMGTTEEGRTQYMSIITDPSNHRSLDRYIANAKRLAMAKDVKDEATAREVAKSGKAIVWIDGGLHATEVLGAQQLLETAYQLVSRNDEENTRILKDCIVLLVHANPDGMDLVSDWYMRRSNPESRSLSGVPVLYEKYCGHDNNRDFYANNTKESQNMSRVLYQTHFPQILYNHHQSSPAGTIMFIPPFRNPFNFHVDPLVQVATDVVGMHMHQRLISEGKGGTVMRNGANFSTWWNGGLRTTTYFHNMIGILTETWGSPNPSNVPYLANRQVPTIDIPKPIDAGPWRLKQSLAYEISANYAILDYASRYKEHVQFNVWRAARTAVERGQKDSWTRYPSRLEKMGAESLKDPSLRDARFYVLPSTQTDFGTALLFAKKLWQSGVEIHRLNKDTVHNGKTYPEGSIVIRCDQAYRAHVLDMFEKQDYPNDFQYPGGPPNPPYDNSGYTMAFTMGVDFDRILDDFKGEMTLIQPDESTFNRLVNFDASTKAFWLPSNQNASYSAAMTCLEKGMSVSRITEGTESMPAGSFYVELGAKSAADWGLKDVFGVKIAASVTNAAASVHLEKPRIALWDRYGGSMPSGWTRYIFDTFKFPYANVWAPDLDSGSLNDKFDVIVFPSGAGFSANPGIQQELSNDQTIADVFKKRMGNMTVAKTLPKLKEFVENGGHIVLIGEASDMATEFGIGINSALMETVDGRTRRVANTKHYVPAAVLRMNLDSSSTLCYGMPSEVDVMFDANDVFNIQPSAANVNKVGWFGEGDLLRSGWAWGQEYLRGKTTLVDVSMGKGKISVMSPEITFRAQPHGTYKLLFNAIFRSASK